MLSLFSVGSAGWMRSVGLTWTLSWARTEVARHMRRDREFILLVVRALVSVQLIVLSVTGVLGSVEQQLVLVISLPLSRLAVTPRPDITLARDTVIHTELLSPLYE